MKINRYTGQNVKNETISAAVSGSVKRPATAAAAG